MTNARAAAVMTDDSDVVGGRGERGESCRGRSTSRGRAEARAENYLLEAAGGGTELQGEVEAAAGTEEQGEVELL